MKKLLTLLLLTAAAARAVDVTVQLEWTDPNPVGTVKEYRVFHTSPGNAVTQSVVTKQMAQVQVQAGTNKFTVYAVSFTDVLSDATSTSAYVPHPIADLKVLVIIPVPSGQ